MAASFSLELKWSQRKKGSVRFEPAFDFYTATVVSAVLFLKGWGRLVLNFRCT
jgi:hypothetical protein